MDTDSSKANRLPLDTIAGLFPSQQVPLQASPTYILLRLPCMKSSQTVLLYAESKTVTLKDLFYSQIQQIYQLWTFITASHQESRNSTKYSRLHKQGDTRYHLLSKLYTPFLSENPGHPPTFS